MTERARIMVLEIVPKGRAFRRPGGRDGGCEIDDECFEPDDFVCSPFDFVTVYGLDAEAALVELKRMRPSATPMILGSPHEAGMLFERMDMFPKAPLDWLQEAKVFDVDWWHDERRAERAAWYRKTGDEFPLRGPWPDEFGGLDSLLVPYGLMEPDPKPVVIVALLPTADPTEAAAYLRFGGWNDCPKPPVHIALARRWREQYGAVQVSNTHDTIEFRVARPLTDRDEALELAMLQYHYGTCGNQDTLEDTAADLIGATVWHFWWD